MWRLLHTLIFFCTDISLLHLLDEVVEKRGSSLKKAHYKKSIIALLVVLMYLLIAVAFAKILPLAVLQDLTNSNIKDAYCMMLFRLLL